MNTSSQILIVSSDLESRSVLASILQQEGLSPICASHVRECQEALTNQAVSLVFCERRLADGSYRDLLSAAPVRDRHIPVIVTSRLADWDEYLEASHHGALDLIASPCRPGDVLSAIAQAKLKNQHRPSLVSSPQA
jgi:DNA-binding NtrC family response regulator